MTAITSKLVHTPGSKYTGYESSFLPITEAIKTRHGPFIDNYRKRYMKVLIKYTSAATRMIAETSIDHKQAIADLVIMAKTANINPAA